MARYLRRFRFEVVTPDETVFACEAVHAMVPAADGQLGVLGGRGPLIALLGTGRMKVEQPDGKLRHFFVSGGFAHVHEGTMTVLADECIPAEKLDAEKAAGELDAARRMPVPTPQALERRQQAVEAARKKFNMAIRWRHG